MADHELMKIFGKYQKKKMEIERNYNIKKEELEKDYKNQKKNNKIPLLKVLLKKEKSIQNHLEGLQKDLEDIKQISNILSENEDMREVLKLKDMLNEIQVKIVHNVIHLREEEDSQIQENNGMEQSKKEEREEIENIDEEPKKIEFEKKNKEFQMSDRKRKRSPSNNNN
jgi:hypothetical protein